MSGQRWTSRYPPLVSLALVLFLALAVLPSALNLPQSNPSTTLEYAPVPPADKDNPPPGGNLSSLGLASSGTLGVSPLDGGLGGGAAQGPASGVGKSPSTKRCVGKPPRQTEDILSPPCVAYFQGDNFGATYQGVTKDEIRILFYFGASQCISTTSRGAECRPADTYWDLNEPPREEEHVYTRVLRRFQRYFNDRYQTYDRQLHLYVYYSKDARSDTPGSPELRRADAAENLKRIQPFAIMSYPNTYGEDYIRVAAKAGVLNFGSQLSRPAVFFQEYPGLIWSYLPSIEQQAKVYSDWVCTQVVPYNASFSGNPGENGKPRRLGLLRAADPARPEFVRFAEEAKRRIEACGGTFVAEATYPVASNAAGAGPDGRNNNSVAATNMARFKEQRVTTIVWPQGYQVEHSRAGATLEYRPEWVAAGDGQLEGVQTGSYQDQSAWDNHAWTVVFSPLVAAVETTNCYKSLQEADPDIPRYDASAVCTFRAFYDDMRMLVTGIQVAGPRLNPASIDKGYHAIPAVRSADPTVPACFFDPGDYTCIKDAALAYWQTERKVTPWPGCWRMAQNGQRYFAGAWPKADVSSMRTPNDPCNSFAGSASR